MFWIGEVDEVIFKYYWRVLDNSVYSGLEEVSIKYNFSNMLSPISAGKIAIAIAP